MEREPGFFDYGGAFMRFFQYVVELIVLNVLFLLGCLPLITVGTSLLALNEVSLAHYRCGRTRGVVREFVCAYRRHLRQGIVLSAALLLVGGSLALDFRWIAVMPNGFAYGMLLGALAVLAVVLGMLVTCLFPLLGVGEIPLWQGVQEAFRCCLCNWPRVLLISILRIGACVLCLHIPFIFLALLPLMLFVGFALLASAETALLSASLPDGK